MSHFGIDTPFGERLANSSCKTRKLDPDVLDILNCGQSGTLTKAFIDIILEYLHQGFFCKGIPVTHANVGNTQLISVLEGYCLTKPAWALPPLYF